MTEKGVDEVTEELYMAYGSDSGWLFGIEPNLRPAVRGIVKIILERE